MSTPFDTIARIGVVPVITIERVKDALPLADALLAGGLPVAEITFRSPAAADVLARLAAERPDLIVGGGTVLDMASLEACRRSGAKFGLSPGFDPAIVDAAKAAGLPFAPGVMTPSDVTLAAAKGLGLVKFFPAATAGGPTALEGISAPFAHLSMRFIPTGGVSLATIGDWLKLKSVAAVGGTWIATTDDIHGGRFGEIERNAREAVARARASLDSRG